MSSSSKLPHSVKVPKLYKTAAQIVRDVKTYKCSPKSLIFNKFVHPNIKGIYALVQETLTRSTLLEKLFDKTQFFKKENPADKWLPMVLLTELLFGKKILPGDSKPVKSILKYKECFTELLAAENDEDLLNTTYREQTRCVRVNTLVMSVPEVIQSLKDDGWILIEKRPHSYKHFLDQIKELEGKNFIVDYHIDHLLIFPVGTSLINTDLYKRNALFIQAKSSCMASFLVNPEPGSTVLDMCAAPGMKTSHMAALMQNQGTVYAVERDSSRTESLMQVVKKSRATCVKILNQDALTVTPTLCPNVKYILVDPTCSGSGLHHSSKKSPEMLTRISSFQKTILKKALIEFPTAKRVVYSTCSIHAEENEEVVEDVIQSVSDFEVKHVMHDWLSRGSQQYPHGLACLYARPEIDLTTGFFIAVFERKSSQQCSPLFSVLGGNSDHEIAVKRAKESKLFPKQAGIACKRNEGMELEIRKFPKRKIGMEGPKCLNLPSISANRCKRKKVKSENMRSSNEKGCPFYAFQSKRKQRYRTLPS